MTVEAEPLTAAALFRAEKPIQAVIQRVRLEPDRVFNEVEDGDDSGPADEIGFRRRAGFDGVRGIILPDRAGALEYLADALQVFEGDLPGQLVPTAAFEAADNHGVGRRPDGAPPVAAGGIEARLIGRRRRHTMPAAEALGIPQLGGQSVSLVRRGHAGQQRPIGGDRLDRRRFALPSQVEIESAIGVPHALVDEASQVGGFSAKRVRLQISFAAGRRSWPGSRRRGPFRRTCQPPCRPWRGTRCGESCPCSPNRSYTGRCPGASTFAAPGSSAPKVRRRSSAARDRR